MWIGVRFPMCRKGQNKKYMNYANKVGWSDSHPYEVIEMKPKSITVRAMDSVLSKDWKPIFHAGGYAGHCVNNKEQVWEYSINESNPVETIRLHKDGRWYDKYKNRYLLSDHPRRFYDYNF